MYRNIRAENSEVYRLLSTMYLVSGFKNPYFEFKQVRKGFFECTYFKNLLLEISNEEYNGIKGSMLNIIDLRTNTKVSSKYIKECKEILFLDTKSAENTHYKSFSKNLRLEDFQYQSIDREPYVLGKNKFLDDFYLSAKFKISDKENFEFKFTFFNNSILLNEPIGPNYSVCEANDEEIAQMLFDFNERYNEIYKMELDLFNYPYLNFF